MGNLLQQQGAARAGGQAAPYQALSGALTGGANMFLGSKLGLF